MMFLRVTIIAVMLYISMNYAMDKQIDEYAICRSIEEDREDKKYFASLSPEARKSLIEGYNNCRIAHQLKARKEFEALKSRAEKHAYLIRHTKWIEYGS